MPPEDNTSDFSTATQLRVELDSRSVDSVKQELEREFSTLDALAVGVGGGSGGQDGVGGDIASILEDDLQLSRDRNDLLRQIEENTDQEFGSMGGFDVPTPKPRTPGRRGGFGGVGGFGIGALAIADALKQDPVDTQQTSEGPVLPPDEIIGPIQTGEGDTPGTPASALTGSGSARPDAGRDIPGLPDISGGPDLSELAGGVLTGGATLAGLAGASRILGGVATRSAGGGVAISRGRFERGLQNVEQTTADVSDQINNTASQISDRELINPPGDIPLVNSPGGGGPVYTGPDPFGLGGSGGSDDGSDNDENQARKRSAKSMNTTISPTVNVQGVSRRDVEDIAERKAQEIGEELKKQLDGFASGF